MQNTLGKKSEATESIFFFKSRRTLAGKDSAYLCRMQIKSPIASLFITKFLRRVNGNKDKRKKKLFIHSNTKNRVLDQPH